MKKLKHCKINDEVWKMRKKYFFYKNSKTNSKNEIIPYVLCVTFLPLAVMPQILLTNVGIILIGVCIVRTKRRPRAWPPKSSTAVYIMYVWVCCVLVQFCVSDEPWQRVSLIPKILQCRHSCDVYCFVANFSIMLYPLPLYF